ncbi:MAG: hypothetical protein NT084_05840 [Bacteroidetes bacterium]|nr:hypothetical protein [Bacteroidota bacterium]
MCFSATASFTSGAVLAVIGIASLKNVRTMQEGFFAFIPLIFSIQQIAEGFLWLALSEKTLFVSENFSTYFFIIIAQIVWPIWVPLSISLIETNKKRKKTFLTFTVLGTCLSIAVALFLFNNKIHARIAGHHITYVMNFPIAMQIIGGVFYFMVTVVPAFISTNKKMPYLGALILISFIVTEIFYERYVISVWCFFGAIICIMIYFISKDVGNKAEPKLDIVNN